MGTNKYASDNITFKIYQRIPPQLRCIMIFKRFLRKIGRKEHGMILPLALILLVAATLIVVPGLGLMYSLLTINSNAQQDMAAYYAADAGIRHCTGTGIQTSNSITSTYLPTILNPISTG